MAWLGAAVIARQGAAPLPTPAFHHLHLNLANPEAAIDFYTRVFPSTAKGTFAGQPALTSPTDVWILFTRVGTPPARGVQPRGGAGFAYLRGPDDALVEYQGDQPRERFNHIHMYQEQPFCAQLWYQKHLHQAPPSGATVSTPPRTEANCRVERGPDKTWPALAPEGMYRTPSLTSMAFSDVSLFAYMNQADTPLG